MRIIIYLLALITGLCAVEATSAHDHAPMAIGVTVQSEHAVPSHAAIIAQQNGISHLVPARKTIQPKIWVDPPFANFAQSTPIVRADRAHI